MNSFNLRQTHTWRKGRRGEREEITVKFCLFQFYFQGAKQKKEKQNKNKLAGYINDIFWRKGAGLFIVENKIKKKKIIRLENDMKTLFWRVIYGFSNEQ